MKKLSREEMKNVKGGVTPCLSRCYGECSQAGGGAQVVLACRQNCRDFVCNPDDGN